MKKQCFIGAVLIAMLAFVCTPAFAADNLVFQGDTQKFVTDVSGSATGGFTGMVPGEARDLTLTLTNNDKQNVDFFMSSEILNNIAEQGDKNAVYDFNISKNGQVFFKSVIGGSSPDKQNISIGAEYLTEDNNILLDTMVPGQTDTVSISLKLDGDSTDDTYQDKEGKVQFVFSAGAPVSNDGGTLINRIVKTVTRGSASSPDTGVNGGAMLMVALLLVVVAIVLIAAVVVRRKRNEGDQS
ncbi:MAG: hypothetical protein IJH61_06155 [Eubacteriaceae bacterium]|nr:hypothetical protein [Eubacteriaceae bacterium]